MRLLSPFLSQLTPPLPMATDSKPSPGEAMLEQYRKAGKPIPPQVEKMAAWLDKMDAESAQDVPMVKPGGWFGCVCMACVTWSADEAAWKAQPLLTTSTSLAITSCRYRTPWL